MHPGVADGLVHHGLLVAGLVVGQEVRVVGVELREGLPDARDVAVAEDAEGAGHGALAVVAVDGDLAGEELHQRLTHGHAAGGGARAGGAHTEGPSGVNGSRGSSSSPAHVDRTQA